MKARTTLCIALVFALLPQLCGQEREDSLLLPRHFESILAKAASQRAQHWQRYQRYEAQSYQRCKAQLKSVSFYLWKVSGIMIPHPRDTGTVYYSEALVESQFDNYYRHQSRVLSKREWGGIPVYNWNHTPDYNFNILQKRVYIQELFERGFASPLSLADQRYYRFEDGGQARNEQGQKITWIHFRPRRSGLPGMHGRMALEDSSGLALEVHFSLTADNQLEQLDSISVSQYFRLQNDQYRQVRQVQRYYLNIFGFRGHYEIQQDHLRFQYRSAQAPLADFDPLVYQLDSAAFQAPEALNTARNRLGLNSDSITSRLKPLRDRPLPRYRFRENSRYRQEPYSLWRNSYRSYDLLPRRRWFVDIPAFYKGLGYNAVEGPYLRQELYLGHSGSRREWTLRGQLRYGLADDRLKPSAQLSMRWGQRQRQEISLAGGRDYRQLNEKNPISPLLNTLFSLGLGENNMSLFDKEFLALSYANHSTEGWQIQGRLEWSQRRPLFNRSRWTPLDPLADFAPNNPNRGNINAEDGFKTHQALVLSTELSYQFEAQYRQAYRQSTWDVHRGYHRLAIRAPEIYYQSRWGLGAEAFHSQFFFQKLGYRHRFRIGSLGLSQIDLSAGHFLWRSSVAFVDFHHFDGTQILFLQGQEDPNLLNQQFNTLPYYTYSTTQPYLELHFEHNFAGALLSDWGFMRRNKIHSLAGLNSLHINGRSSFVEVYFGFTNIFKIMRVQLAGGVDQFWQLRPSLRVGFDFDYDYYRLHRNFSTE